MGRTDQPISCLGGRAQSAFSGGILTFDVTYTHSCAPSERMRPYVQFHRPPDRIWINLRDTSTKSVIGILGALPGLWPRLLSCYEHPGLCRMSSLGSPPPELGLLDGAAEPEAAPSGGNGASLHDRVQHILKRQRLSRVAECVLPPKLGGLGHDT